MTTHPLNKGWMLLPAVILLAVTAGTTFSASFTIRAGVDNLVMPDNTVVRVWGYAPVAGFDNNNNLVSVPGPVMTVPAGDTTLTVIVQDNLPTGNFTSLVVPGQLAVMTPVWTDNAGVVTSSTGSRLPGDVTSRVRSFTTEASSGGTQTYTWTGLKPGTFLYESGTDPSVQVQMGLYGAVIVRPTVAGQAYNNASTAFDNEAVLLFSEIDPFLHHAVDNIIYGTPAFPSTMQFEPKYFLINGLPYTRGRLPIGIAPATRPTLLRFLNAGSLIYDPTLLGPIMTVIGEDGNLLPFPETLSTLFLPPGKTHDVLVTPAKGGKFALFDRRLNVVNNFTRPGGAMAMLVPAGSDVAGPVVSVLAASPNPTMGASPVLLTATATDNVVDAGSIVTAAEWYTDNTTLPGAGNPMGGGFGSSVVALSAAIDNSALRLDNNVIFVRAQDSYGNWGPVDNVVVNVRPATASSVFIVKTSYGVGNVLIVEAKSIAAPGSVTLTVSSPLAPEPMAYVAGSQIYVSQFPVYPPPAMVTVTVSGAGGGSATAPVPFP